MVHLVVGNTYSNDDICEIFKCSPQGGMRRSLETNSLVLISNQTQPTERNPYRDYWQDSIFYYTGMGLRGDQSLSFAQNKTLAESPINGVDVHLFEVYEPRKYTYRGRVKLAGNPFQTKQPDSNNVNRKVWIFPLKLI